MGADAKLAGTVLVVEDDDATREALARSLGRRVDKVWLAEDGRAGLRMFSEHAPDVVITDITMPGLSGLELARAIKATHPDVPVIVTTAYSDTQFLLDAIEIGIDGYVLKPVNLQRMVDAVRRNLAIVHSQREAQRHQEEQRRLLHELQEAMKQIRTLSGMLPICAGCKNIRDDRGYWTQIEKYMADHANVSFTHSLCPRCIAKYYPELVAAQDDDPRDPFDPDAG